MMSTLKPLTALAAEDVMSRSVLVIPSRMSLRAAARILSRANVTGAPVVDEVGACVGVLSAVDFLHFVQGDRPLLAPRPTDCVCTAWQVVEADQVPAEEEVSGFMTRDIVTASPSESVVGLAKIMTDAHIHRVIIVDAKKRPVGIVTTTDVIAAVAREQ